MDFENLHQILRSLYDEMMPLCSDMTDIAKGLAGLGALFYVALRVWQSLSRAEPIDVFPLLRPFAIGLAIMFFPTIVLGTLNSVMSPIVQGTHSMLETQTWLCGKVLGMFFLFHSILYLCIMNMLEQLARIVLPKEILDNFDIVKIETDESDIDSMSMTIYLDERMNAYLQKSEDYESKGFMDAVRITDFPIRDHKVILVLRRRRWKNKETGETFVDRISVTESGTRYSKEFAAFLKETYGHIPDDLPYA